VEACVHRSLYVDACMHGSLYVEARIWKPACGSLHVPAVEACMHGSLYDNGVVALPRRHLRENGFNPENAAFQEVSLAAEESHNSSVVVGAR
jgi:hypothetical protein